MNLITSIRSLIMASVALLFSCSTVPYQVYTFTPDGITNSFLEGEPSQIQKMNGLEVQGIYTGYNHQEKSLSFKFNIFNPGSENALFDTRKVVLEMTFNSIPNNEIVTTRLALKDVINLRKALDGKIVQLEAEKEDEINSFFGLIDAFSKDTENKKLREEKRDQKVQQLTQEISALKTQKNNSMKDALLSTNVKAKEEIKGIFYFPTNDLSFLSNPSTRLKIIIPSGLDNGEEIIFNFKTK